MEELFEKSIIGTIMNHPKWNFSDNIYQGIENYVKMLKEKKEIDQSAFYNKFSSNLDNIQLRPELIKKSTETDIVYEFLDILYNFSISKIKEQNIKPEDYIDLSIYIKNLSNLKTKYGNNLKNALYIYPVIFDSNILPFIKNVIKIYINDLEKKDIFNLNSIEFQEITKTATKIFTNEGKYGLKDSFSAELLSGKIQIESRRGYLSNKKHVQQDAVGASVKSENCFINIVADGAGGSLNGEKASNEIVSDLLNWFNNMDENDLCNSDLSFVATLINREVINSNNKILKQFPGSYTTLVFSLTLNDKTLIGNIGDSTAYTLDNDNLIQLTTLDSLSNGMTYEEARNNPNNNIITSAIGLERMEYNTEYVHFVSINNIGQRIIISSDGVTDLVDENKFKSYFKNRTKAKDIVDDAIYRPNVIGSMKNEDNVSAIVVDLPNSLINNNGRKL